MSFHAILVAGALSGSGKSTVATGLARVLSRRGNTVQPFKCGPDYIDTLHLARAAERPAHNLDTVMLSENRVKNLYARSLRGADIAVIEGAMGFFDGIDARTFSGSAYDVAVTLDIPVLLVVDCSGASYTVVALIRGLQEMAKDVRIIGVILNNVASPAHEQLVKAAITEHSNVFVLGTIPRQKAPLIESRHLGVKGALEQAEEYYDACAKLVNTNCDIGGILRYSATTPPKPVEPARASVEKHIAWVARDAAFSFIYQANIDFLTENNFSITFFSPLNGDTVPDDADFVYIGGGYPEIHAKTLSENNETRNSILKHAMAGKPMLAECGGMMYLAKEIATPDGVFPMVGVFDVKTEMMPRRQALGYVKIELVNDCFIGEAGMATTGHEYHYSRFVDVNEPHALKLTRLTTGETHPDGFIKNRTVAMYAHQHFLAKNSFIAPLLREVTRD